MTKITDMDEIFDYLDNCVTSPVRDYEVTKKQIMERYNLSERSATYMMDRLVDEGKAQTRMAFDDESHRRVRVWWFEKDEPDS